MDQPERKEYQNGEPADADDKPDTESIWVGEEEFWPLSGKPYFHISLKKTNLHPYYRMIIPKKMSDLLPSTTVPAIMNCRGRNWTAMYNKETLPRQLHGGWRSIAEMCKLKKGDVCVFELTENSTRILKFRLQILRGDFPPELLARVAKGQTAEAAILID